MDRYEYMAQVHDRQFRARMLLGLGAVIFLAFGLGLLAFASQETEIKKSGFIGFRKETVVPIPTETRLTLLLSGIVLMLVAFTLAVILFRATRTHLVPSPSQIGPVGMASVGPSGSQRATSGRMEFWTQTVIAVVGLIVTAASAALAWWAG